MENVFQRKLKDTIRKNKNEFVALSTFSLPRFVYKSSLKPFAGEIPVFNFHKADVCLLEEQLSYLYENGYRTLSATELLDYLNGKRITNNSVVLTFDDGRKDLWTIAYPLLKKYNITAIAFIIPSVIEESSEVSFNLENVWSDEINLCDLENIQLKKPFCNWTEIEIMHRSGLIDFQSHSLYHASIFSDDTLINFVNPNFKASILDSTFNPLESLNRESITYGSPVFRWEPNLVSEKRFILNKAIAEECTGFVKENGGEKFFNRTEWKKLLMGAYNSAVRKDNTKGVFQHKNQRMQDIINDLSYSKKIIEEHLNKPVYHLCYPWFRGSNMSVELSRSAGYKTNYWGIHNNTSINRRGDDPMFIKRINDYYIFSLPGKNRINLLKQFINKFKNN